MRRDGAIIFRDLVGNLDVLNVECDKCGRRGRYRLDRLIEQYGIDAKLFDSPCENLAANSKARIRACGISVLFPTLPIPKSLDNSMASVGV